MLRCIRDKTPCIPDWWSALVLDKAVPILCVGLTVTIVLGAYAVFNFRIDTELTEMVSAKLPFRQQLTRFRKAFPQLNDSLVLVIDAPTPEQARYARDLLIDHLNADQGVFHSIYAPRGGKFLERNGLLYQDHEALNDLADNLAQIQPFLGLLSRNLSLENLFNTLAQALESDAELLVEDRLNLLFAHLNEAFHRAEGGQSTWISWQEIMQGAQGQESYREFIVLWPYLDYASINPAKRGLASVGLARQKLQKAALPDVSVRLTGSLALRVDNLVSSREGIGLAAAISFLLVAAILAWGLKSMRLVIHSLVVLSIGLIWTLGFAIVFIGRLNIISVTFVVLFIGLGVDYCIQFCLRYRELRHSAFAHAEAIKHSISETGNALLLCSLTTAIGFYAFVPTAYAGASELGLIAGTGMFIIYFAAMTVLPALIHLWRPDLPQAPSPSARSRGTIAALPSRFPKTIVVATGLLVLGGSALLPAVYFDYNPLNLNNQRSESVQTAKQLFQDPDTAPWTLSVMADSAAEIKGMADRLANHSTVAKTISLQDLVPADQAEKIAIVDEMGLFMPPLTDNLQPVSTSTKATRTALVGWHDALARFIDQNPNQLPAARDLHERIGKIVQNGTDPQALAAFFDQLRPALLMPLKLLLERLTALMQPEPFDADQLPPEIKRNYYSDNHYRLQIFPSENIDDLATLQRFVSEVQRIAPQATGTPAGIIGAGEAIANAFARALVIAVILIIVLLFFVIRKPLAVLLILSPLAAALGVIAGVTVVFHLPFNFANIIVVPLLLGIGIDYAIHLVYRFLADPAIGDRILQTSTARGILFSALTTIASFSSLSFSAHSGTASMGVLLTIGVTVMIGCTLLLLPALLVLAARNPANQDPAAQLSAPGKG